MDNTLSQTNAQQKNIFKDFAYQLCDKGIPCVPLNGKIPVLKNWQKYQKQPVPDMVLESWETQYPDKNIGLVLGEQSNIVAVDYDAINEDKEVSSIIPRSMVERFGKKGFVRFFRFNGERGRKFNHIQVEILSSGNQVVLPPSIHPDTNQPYKWTSLRTVYDIDAEDLEQLPEGFIEQLEQLNEKAKKNAKKNKGTPAQMDNLGRNNTLFSQCSAMVNDGVRREVITKRLLEFDQENHKVPWFTDETEPHKGNTDLAVSQMIERAASLDGNYTGETLLTYANLIQNSPDNEVFQPLKPETDGVSPIAFPAVPKGMKPIYSLNEELGDILRPEFFLASSVSLIGHLLANKTTFRNTAPCLFQLLLTESGGGKDAPLKFPQRILQRIGKQEQVGLNKYVSDKALQKPLTKVQERFDTLDEIGSLFKGMNSASGASVSNVGEVLSSIWSSSSDFWHGSTNSEETVGACVRPCISLLGATTPGAFSRTFGLINIEQGLAGRFLYIFDDKKVKRKRGKKHLRMTEVPDSIKLFAGFIDKLDIKKKEIPITDITGSAISKPHDKKNLKELKETDFETTTAKEPIELICEPQVEELIEDYADHWFYNKGNYDKKLLPVINRITQQLFKVIQIHYVCRLFREELQRKKRSGVISEKATFEKIIDKLNPNNAVRDNLINIDDFIWSKQYVEACLYSTSKLFSETVFESVIEKDTSSVLQIIEQNEGMVTFSLLRKKLGNKYKDKQLVGNDGILTHLSNIEKIVQLIRKPEGRGRPSKLICTAKYYNENKPEGEIISDFK